MNQKYSSKNTSINHRLPAVYGKLAKAGIALTNALDYGCGRYFDGYNLANVVGYDPFNYVRPENVAPGKHYSEGVLSNVLNVIEEEGVRSEILSTLATLCDTVYITVYTGNNSGVGAPSGEDSYQLNRPLKGYVEEVARHFSNVKVKRGMIIATA